MIKLCLCCTFAARTQRYHSQAAPSAKFSLGSVSIILPMASLARGAGVSPGAEQDGMLNHGKQHSATGTERSPSLPRRYASLHKFVVVAF